MCFTEPLLDMCQGKDNEWHRASTGANEGWYEGHEGADDNNDGWPVISKNRIPNLILPDK